MTEEQFLSIFETSIDFIHDYNNFLECNRIIQNYDRSVRVRRKKPHSANRKKPIFDKRKEPKLPESDLLFRVIQAVPLQEQPLFF
jgi:hypothetical protein